MILSGHARYSVMRGPFAVSAFEMLMPLDICAELLSS